MTGEKISDYFVADRGEILDFLGRQGVSVETTLDIGCSSGRLGAEYVNRSITRQCDGIEPNQEAAQRARANLRQVWCGTMEAVRDAVPWAQYDLVSLADVLEHLPDPWDALRFLHRHTSSGCRLMLSVPNIRHYKVLMPLIFNGEFRYVDRGIMDRTHLHFFTRSSLCEMLAESGWKVGDVGAHMKSRYRRWYYPTNLIEPFVAVQYMLIAEKR